MCSAQSQRSFIRDEHQAHLQISQESYVPAYASVFTCRRPKGFALDRPVRPPSSVALVWAYNFIHEVETICILDWRFSIADSSTDDMERIQRLPVGTPRELR